MKYVETSITLGNKQYSAIEVDYDEYDDESGSIKLNNKTYFSNKKFGIESDD